MAGMDKEVHIRVRCETERHCLDAVSEDGTTLIAPSVCLKCDYAIIEFLLIKDYVLTGKEETPEDKLGKVRLEGQTMFPGPETPEESKQRQKEM